MRLPSARTQFLAFLVPFLGVTLTFGGSGIKARRAGNSQSSRTRACRALRATVGHEWDVIHEEPERHWAHFDSNHAPAFQFPPGPPGHDSAVVAEANPLAPPVYTAEILPREATPRLRSQTPTIRSGRDPPSNS
jgi:hypothetical protein